eukprot:g9347.t1
MQKAGADTKDMKLRKMFDPLFTSLRPRSMMPQPYRLFFQQPVPSAEEGEQIERKALLSMSGQSAGAPGAGTMVLTGRSAATSSTAKTPFGFGASQSRFPAQPSTRNVQKPQAQTTLLERENAKGHLDLGTEREIEFDAATQQQQLQRFALRRADIKKGTSDAKLVETFGPGVVPEVFPYQRKLVPVPESYGYGHPPERVPGGASTLPRGRGLDVELQEPHRFIPSTSTGAGAALFKRDDVIPEGDEGEEQGSLRLVRPATAPAVGDVCDHTRYSGRDGDADPNAVKKARPHYYKSLQRVASTDLTYPINLSTSGETTSRERKTEVIWSALDAALEWNQDERLNVFQQGKWRPLSFPWHRSAIDERRLRTSTAFALSLPADKTARGGGKWELRLVGVPGEDEALVASTTAAGDEEQEEEDPDDYGLLLRVRALEGEKKLVINKETFSDERVKQIFDGAGYQMFLRYSNANKHNANTFELVFHSPGVSLLTLRVPGMSSGCGPAAVLDHMKVIAGMNGNKSAVTGFFVPYGLPLFHEAFNTGAPLVHGNSSAASARDLARRRRIMNELSKKVRTKDEEYLFIVCSVCGWKQRQNLNLDFQKCKRCGKANPTTYPSIVRVMERMRENQDTDAQDFVQYVENQSKPPDPRSWPTRKFHAELDAKSGKKAVDCDVALLGFKS